MDEFRTSPERVRNTSPDVSGVIPDDFRPIPAYSGACPESSPDGGGSLKRPPLRTPDRTDDGNTNDEVEAGSHENSPVSSLTQADGSESAPDSSSFVDPQSHESLSNSARGEALDPAVSLPLSDSAPARAERDASGRFLPGNAASLRHGLFSEQARQFAALRDEAEAFLSAQLADEGDPDVPARRRSLMAYRARVHRRLLQLDEALELRGILGPDGKLRVAWLQRLEGLVATAASIDRLLGLERRQKPVDPSAVLDRYRRRGGDL